MLQQYTGLQQPSSQLSNRLRVRQEAPHAVSLVSMLRWACGATHHKQASSQHLSQKEARGPRKNNLIQMNRKCFFWVLMKTTICLFEGGEILQIHSLVERTSES
jgi:hypothetical protein